jgi:hypothetical protein
VSWAFKSKVPPAGYTYGPSYRPSVFNFLQAGYFILRGKPRVFASDVAWVLRHAPVPPLIRGADLIPEGGRFVIVANHYERPGLWMAWPAGFIAHVVQQRTGKDAHWIAIGEWQSFTLGPIHIPSSITRTVFERAYGAYGLIAMAPPTAPASARASSIKAAVKAIKEGGIVGLMPEGTVGLTPELLPAREGVGTFLMLLAHAGARILPVGFYEEQERLVAQVGAPFDLEVPSHLPKSDRDRWVSDRIMCSIRTLLPEPLWGAYKAGASPVKADAPR